MSRSFAWQALAPSLVLLSGLPFLQATEPATEEKPSEVLLEEVSRISRGTTGMEVRRRLGPPRHIARQILYRHSIEQWIYGEPAVVRVEFDRVKGQEPQVLTVRTLLPTKP